MVIKVSPNVTPVTVVDNGVTHKVVNEVVEVKVAAANVVYSIYAGTATITAAENLGGHRVVTVEGYYASKDTSTDKFKILGITTGAASIGTTATVTTFGSIEESGWNWTVGNPVFLSTNGQLTQTAPTSGFSLIVGRPKTATNLFIDISEPTILA